MDPAHGPFVHQSWWWRSQASIHEKEKHFEPIEQGFRMTAHQPSANSAPYKLLGVYGEKITTTIDFVLPNRRYEVIRAGEKWFASLTTVTPTIDNNCRIDVCAAWNIFLNVPFLTSIAKFFGNRFVRQDQDTMIQQAEGLKYNPSLMLIDDADRPAKWYFELKQARLESQATGQPMRHPMDVPVDAALEKLTMAGPLQLSWKFRSRLRMLAIALLLGAAVGIFVLYPTNEFVYFYEYQPTADTKPVDFAVHQMQRSLQGQTPRKTIFYAIVGMILSVGGARTLLQHAAPLRAHRATQRRAGKRSAHAHRARREREPGIQIVVPLGPAREQSQSRAGRRHHEDPCGLHEWPGRNAADRRCRRRLRSSASITITRR